MKCMMEVEKVTINSNSQNFQNQTEIIISDKTA
jgi:hypothetical protein